MIDPQSRNVTSTFMVLAIIVMAALAWSASRNKTEQENAAATEATACTQSAQDASASSDCDAASDKPGSGN